MTEDPMEGSPSLEGSAARDGRPRKGRPIAGVAAYLKPYRAKERHGGLPYIEFLGSIAAALSPASYLEIGTSTGSSLCQFSCDALCIDPHFQIAQDVLSGRTRTFFFQMTADDFFRHETLQNFMPRGVDIAFIDGLHRFEAALRDFINIEAHCHSRSVVLIHDCLPPERRITERRFSEGMWTGDVWRLLPIFHRYRPDLRISCWDTPPTGLVACTRLDPRSTVLRDNYFKILDEFSNLDLNDEALDQIGRIYPFYDSARLAAAPEDMPLFFG